MKRLPVTAISLTTAIFFAAGARAAGPQLWGQAGCGGCHTLAAAGSDGQVGPNLDQLRPSASRIALQITDGGTAMPSFSGSLSSSEIQSLAAWIASVAAGGSSSSTTGSAGLQGPSGPGGAITRMTVAQVKRLQAELARLGYFHHVVTGYYGTVTTAAVKRFQRTIGLRPDGIWGPHSEAALKRRLAGG
jgi:cytochrome c553